MGGATVASIATTDREDLPDPGGRAEYHLHDCAELPVGARTGASATPLPGADRQSDRGHLRRGQRGRVRPRMGDAADRVHRVADQHLVPHREAERLAEHVAGVLGAAVAGLPLLLDEPVAASDTDLAQREVLELGQHEVGHVPAVQPPRAGCEVRVALHVGQPVVGEVLEGAVRGRVGVAGAVLGASGELLFQRPLGGATGAAGGLHEPGDAVPVAETGSRGDGAGVGGRARDFAGGADRQAWPHHRVTARRDRAAAPATPGHPARRTSAASRSGTPAAEATGPPVVDGRHRHAEGGGERLDVDELLQTGDRHRRGRERVHADQVRKPAQNPAATRCIRSEDQAQSGREGDCDQFSMTTKCIKQRRPETRGLPAFMLW